MGKYDVNLINNYSGMPKNVKHFIEKLIGKEETKKLMQGIKCHHFIMLVGPECSGKSTIAFILRRLGYPFVIDDNGWGMVIRTSQKISDQSSELKSYHAIAEELGI